MVVAFCPTSAATFLCHQGFIAVQHSFSIGALLYGDHTDLAVRCLSSLERAPFDGFVANFHIGLNNVCKETEAFASNWANRISKRSTRVFFYVPVWGERPAFKYPVMRRMLYTGDIRQYFMWFDDDSYLSQQDPAAARGWWTTVANRCHEFTVVGQRWERAMNVYQWRWINTQRWANPSLKYRKFFEFPQGAWWAAKTAFLRQHNWPFPELRHCGGDAMLGELCRHQGVTFERYYEGVRVNADKSGTHSGAPRRGHSEEVIASRFTGQPLNTEHQNVEIKIFTVEV